MNAQLPETCRAVVFHGPDRSLEVTQFARPIVKAREALVRMSCCTICGSDLHTFQGDRQEATPTILGHEAVGIIEEVGQPAPTDLLGSPLSPGDRITWSVAVSCFQCDRCLSGFPQKCRELFKYGHSLAEGPYALSGGLAEWILLRAGSSVMRLAPELPDSVAAPANCATATVAACVRAAGAVNRKRVLIFGAGMLGLTAAAFADDLGAAQVVIIDPSRERLKRASTFGASETLEWHAGISDLRQALQSRGLPTAYDITLELSGTKRAAQSAICLADIGCHVVLAGTVLPTPNIEIDPQRLVRQCMTIRGVHNYTPRDLQSAVEFLLRAHHKYPFEKLIARSFPLEETSRALEFAIRERPVRVAIV